MFEKKVILKQRQTHMFASAGKFESIPEGKLVKSFLSRSLFIGETRDQLLSELSKQTSTVKQAGLKIRQSVSM